MSTGRMGRRPNLSKRIALAAAVGAVLGGGLWVAIAVAAPNGPNDVIWVAPVGR